MKSFSKKIILIVDGMGDLPCPKLGGMTPLEAARTPFMDFLARNGETGVMYPIAPGIAPESDEAMISLLGNNVFRVHRGRGPLEAYGSGVRFSEGDVILRVNFAFEKDGFIEDVRSKLSTLKMKKLVSMVNKRICRSMGIRLVHTVGYRAVLIIPKKISPRVTNTHPGYKIVNNFVTSAQPLAGRKLKIKKCLPLEKSAERTAEIVNEFTKRCADLLKSRKDANYVLVRGAGNTLPKLIKLNGKWAIITDMPIESGIGRLVGMVVLKKKKFKSMKSSVSNVFKILLKNWDKFDSFYLQIKGPDVFGHIGDALGKKKSIELIDKVFIRPLLKKINLKDTLIVITADHSTPCSKMAHSSDPVPLLVFGKKVDKVENFSEMACKKGTLGLILGNELFKKAGLQ